MYIKAQDGAIWHTACCHVGMISYSITKVCSIRSIVLLAIQSIGLHLSDPFQSIFFDSLVEYLLQVIINMHS